MRRGFYVIYFRPLARFLLLSFTGFQPAFEVAQDLAIDVPAVYANFGKLLGQTFAKGHLTFKVIKGALGTLRASDKAGLVMCEVCSILNIPFFNT